MCKLCVLKVMAATVLSQGSLPAHEPEKRQTWVHLNTHTHTHMFNAIKRNREGGRMVYSFLLFALHTQAAHPFLRGWLLG
jgi:hypothetical protein